MNTSKTYQEVFARLGYDFNWFGIFNIETRSFQDPPHPTTPRKPLQVASALPLVERQVNCSLVEHHEERWIGAKAKHDWFSKTQGEEQEVESWEVAGSWEVLLQIPLPTL